ncbi:TLC domain-containing protein [Podospora didyma]|uniref:TLC domain-containing protein n=1 Tax=Podospora didyma TaxID=330526 RepID=A0AAE0KE36_9PEZI|nr:TLC domain-containing protein [Podospora didyma]
MNGPLYRQTINKKAISTRKKDKGDDPMDNLTRWFLENQTGLSFNVLALLFMTHAMFSKARPVTSKFFTLSHYNAETGKYAAGFDDLYFMTFCIVLFTGLRAGVMEYILAPLAKHWGLTKRKEVTRFSEQAWLFTYCSVFWPLGLYIYCNSTYFLNMTELWTNWPDRELMGIMKGYMLAQWSFWIQQVLVIHIEDRRKDHWQMLVHHFVTITLISTSYAYHQTKVGHMILVLMDVVDLFLPLGKCLKYLGYKTICDVVFGLFMVSWFFARHVLYLMTCWSIYADLPRLVSFGCYSGNMNDRKGPLPVPDGWSHVFEPFLKPEGLVCWNDNTTFFFLFCLLFLQVITIMWFLEIVRIAARVLKGGSAEDTRSDDEAEEDEEEFEYHDLQPIKEEVGVEQIDLHGWGRRNNGHNKAGVTTSSSVSLPGKELLNRIGCEKQIE